MLSGVHPELLAFGEPWLAREPRLLIGCRYAAEGAPRARVLAAQLLVRELAQSAIAASDRRVAEARLQWWLEEAGYWRQGHPRHPIALGLDAGAAAIPLARIAAACLEWLDQPPDSPAALRLRLEGIAAQSAQLAACAEPAVQSSWLAAGVRQSLHAPASLASLLPLELCARHGLRRSQWPELDLLVRRRVLAELLASLALPELPRAPCPDAASGAAAHAALDALDRRWLARLDTASADRLGPGDVFAAWRAARKHL